MEEPNKTGTYSDKNKTTINSDKTKDQKINTYPVAVGDSITLNEKEYLIEEIISSTTGEAIIYKVRDPENKLFALKLYFEFNDRELEPNQEALSRIKNIRDTDILVLIDFGTGINKYKGKYCFEISDFAEGHDLLGVTNFKEKYTYEFVLNEVIPQIYKGIVKLHENRIYHCDLKPRNVFFLDKNQKEIVIGDYGSAKTFDFEAAKQSRKTTTIKGTDFYLPPEQAKGFISEKNDYYSFGMILIHLVYPAAVQSSENNPNSLSYSKLKQIIERQFEGKPIIEYNPKFEKINVLIEGLTHIDINRRWGKEEFEKWLHGEKIHPVSPKAPSTSSGALKFGSFIINTPDDLREFILNSSKWYYDLVEDRGNWNDFINWMQELNNGDKRIRSTLNNILKNYSQEGIDFVGEALIRSFFPEEPVLIGSKTFDLTKSDDLKKIVSEIFVYLLNEIWDSAYEKDLKLYLLRIEFTLGYLLKKNQEVKHLLRSLYKNLGIKNKYKPDFNNYRFYAFAFVTQQSKNKIRKFLFEYLPITVTILFDEISKKNDLKYTLVISIDNYFNGAGIVGVIEPEKTSANFRLVFPEAYDSLENFCEKTVNETLQSIFTKHKLNFDKIDKASLKKFKEDFASTFYSLMNEVEDSYEKLKKTLSNEQADESKVEHYLKNIETIIDNKKYYSLNEVFPLIDKTNEKLKKEIEKYKEQKKERNFNLFIRITVTIAVAVPIIATILVAIYDNPSKIKVNKKIALTKIEMVEIEGGTFMMGRIGGKNDEYPPHRVQIDNFSLSKYEITNQQFSAFLNEYGSDEIQVSSDEYEDMIYYKYEPIIIKTDTGWLVKKGYGNFPVVDITWFGANEFCIWAGGRLPTEAEWNFAAIGGNKTGKYQYPGSDSVQEVAWYEDNSVIRLHTVGEKKPNELGLYDMGGNVNEWCLDWYAENYYIISPRDNPVNLTPGKFRVLRGGSYYSPANGILPSNRKVVEPDSHSDKSGFRLCKGRSIKTE